MNTRTGRTTPFNQRSAAAYTTQTPRNTATQQQLPAKKPFVHGGVVSNFTGTPQQHQAVQQPQQQSQQQPAQPRPAPQQQQVKPQAAVQRPQAVQPQAITVKLAQPPMETDVPSEPMNTVDADGNIDGSVDDGSKKRFFGGMLRRRRKLTLKDRRIRQNRILRKMFPPKNALMALNELFGHGECDFNVLPYEGGFTAEIQINNIRYVGRGLSKVAAKTDASEKALRDLVVTKISAVQRKVNKEVKVEGENGSQKESVDGGDGDAEMKEIDKEGSEDVDFPMVHLASFALHKLFTEWQNQGFDVTSVVNQVKAGSNEPPGKKNLPIRSELPANHNTLHPGMLLHMMRPNVSYVDLGSEGQPPNTVHRTGITIEDKNFIGIARNKKAARKSAARQACNALFGTSFVKDELDLGEN